MTDSIHYPHGDLFARSTQRRLRRVSNGEEDVEDVEKEEEEEDGGKSEGVSSPAISNRSSSERSSSRNNEEEDEVMQAIADAVNPGRSQQNTAAPAHGSDSLPTSSGPTAGESADSTRVSDDSGIIYHNRSRGTQNGDLTRDVSNEVMGLREAVQSGIIENVDASLNKGSNVRQELMAQNAENGAGLLMLAVNTGKVYILKHIASEIKARLGMALLAKHLRYKDDTGKPLMFFAAKSSLAMFRAARKLVGDTIGGGGLVEQLRHQCARGMNILMTASSTPDVFAEVRDLAERAGCLEELMEAKDRGGKSWIFHAAEAGNLTVFRQLNVGAQEMYTLFNAMDDNGWGIFMYAARGKNVEVFTRLCDLCFSDEKDSLLREQLTRVAYDDDLSTLLMHAAIGGLEQYAIACRMIRKTGCKDHYWGNLDKNSALLSWAAKGGDVRVLNAVAEGIKTGSFRDEAQNDRTWYELSLEDEATRLWKAVEKCEKRQLGVSLFLSAVESGSLEMMSAVLDGIKTRFQNAKGRWDMLCGDKGNPLAVAAARSVECFLETLKALKGVVLQDSTGDLKPKMLKLLLPDLREDAVHEQQGASAHSHSKKNPGLTPLCNAVFSEDPLLFDNVLEQAKAISRHLSGQEILDQVKYAMRDVDKESRLSEEWISAKMLEKVLQAVNQADKEFDVSVLNDFVLLTVTIRAFDHVRELLRIGCDLTMHFRTLIYKIDKNETSTTECIMLAITASSNPFIECGIASQLIYEAEKRDLNHAALERLHHRIWDLTLELLDHLPRSVKGVGEELARGDSRLDSFDGYIVGKIKPSELLGFVVVGGMLEGGGQFNNLSVSRPLGCESPLAQAIRLGPRALDLLSKPLVMDYLRLKFSRTLPRWNTQKPFERNINQAFYSYAHQAMRSSDESDKRRSRGDLCQWLLLLLQGWKIKVITLPHRTVLPGLQFTLAGIMGKPSSYYVVPAIRMLFIVFNYLATIVVYISCVSLQSQHIPLNEWVFYVIMLSVAWREILEFSNVQKLEPSLEASIERYFYDKWNFLDVITLGLVFVAFVFRMMEFATERSADLLVAQFFLAATAPLLFSRVLFLSQAGSAIGPMTQVIFTMLKELVQFSVVLLIVMIGFAVSFKALFGENTIFVEQNLDDCDVSDHPIVEAFGTLRSALLTMFQSMLGEFDFDLFDARYENADGEDCGSVPYSEFGVILLVIYLVIMAVMLLNLLIAVLSTAHSKVYQNASKEFQLARAKLILQSEDDVLKDVVPPPFNLVKPLLGIFWPASSSGDQEYDRWWEITIGTVHRIIFWFVVGTGALTFTIILWMVSIPMQAWNIYQGKKSGNLRKRKVETKNGERTRITTKCPIRRRPFADDDIADAITENAYTLDTNKERLSPTIARSILVKGLNMLVPILVATAFCLVVYPLLSFILWLRGFGDVLEYIKRMRSRKKPWKRRQADLGEQEEWSRARTHAIRKNKRYATANSSIGLFNVNTLLKTTTGMTMEDLRQDMVNRKSAGRVRALIESSDALLSKLQSKENACMFSTDCGLSAGAADVATNGILTNLRKERIPRIGLFGGASKAAVELK